MLEDWQEFVKSLKKKNRAVFIWSWHEETLAKMKQNLVELRRKNNWKKI